MLYFYPKADTPGCTTEACEFRDAIPDFSGLDAVILGASPDGPKAQAKFNQKFQLPFSLLCDPDQFDGAQRGKPASMHCKIYY